MPRSRWTIRSTAASSAVSWRSSPEEGSSARRIFGSVASARASSTSRQLPSPRELTDTSARRVIPTSSSVASTLSFSSVVAAHVAQVAPEAALAATRALGHHQVVAHAHVGEHLDPLVRPADPEAGTLVGRHPIERLPVEHDVALLGPQLPADAIEEGRLAGSVGADQSDALARGNVERDAADGLDAAERLAHTAQAQEGGRVSHWHLTWRWRAP